MTCSVTCRVAWSCLARMVHQSASGLCGDSASRAIRRALALFLGLWSLTATAKAEVARFGLIVGNNLGAAHEQQLRYAETDARRVRDVLRELGGFAPANLLLLEGEDAETVRASLISLNARIRQHMATPGMQVLFFLYYSGHADASSLHMGETRLALSELRELVQGSAASFRIAVLDACRSGSLTRRKGGKRVEPFALEAEEALPGEGLAFLTASSADEDAQESDALRASFFTHALVSGLLGAADANDDGQVVLDEAYRHAYQATVRSTSRTLAGLQHPTYRYDFRGQGDLVLTRPGRRDPRRSHLQVPPGLTTLLLSGGPDGTVVAEVGARTPQRTLSLRAGPYFVRARGRDVVYEGPIQVTAGASSEVVLADLERIEYARLVRKGGGVHRHAHALELGVQGALPLPNSETPCVGAVAGYALDLQRLGVRARLGLCTASSENARVRMRLMGYSLDLRAYYTWDFGPLAVEVGLGPGLTLFTQDFQTRGEARDRVAVSPFLAVGSGAALDLGHGYYVSGDLSAETHLLRLNDGALGQREDEAVFTLRARLLAGTRF